MHGTKNRVVKPSWGVLYTLGTALVGLVGLIEFTIPAGTLRQTLEVAVTLAGFVAMAIWVRLNRVAFDIAGARNGSPYRIPETIEPGVVSEAQSPHGGAEGGAPLPHCAARREREVREATGVSGLVYGMQGQRLRVRPAVRTGEVSDERRDLHRARARVLRAVLGVREAL
jgi:hypothetical protein